MTTDTSDVMDKPATSPISTRKHGDVMIVLSNNPPVNALGHAVRQGLVAAIEEAEADDSVKAIVIACEGQTFFAGADVSEFGTPKAFEQPMLPQVVDRRWPRELRHYSWSIDLARDAATSGAPPAASQSIGDTGESSMTTRNLGE